MKNSFNIPWKRYGLIAELAARLENKSPQFGKTSLQKMVYLLQEVFGVDCGYAFEFYTYGPFTSQLLQDLDLVEHMGGVSVRPVLSNNWGYEIHPGEKSELIRKKAADFLNAPGVSGGISTLVGEFGNYWAKDLELRSTVVYVERDFKRRDERSSTRETIRVVKQLKPKFSNDEIHEVVDELKSKKYIELDA